MFKNKKIILIVLVILGLLGLFFYNSKIISKEIPNPIGKTYGVKTILEIEGQKYESEVEKEESVYDFMNKFREEGIINFTEKNYTGMGKFINSINGIKGDRNHSWIFYVNNEKSGVGVSNYQIKNGDVVSWKYEENY